MTALRIILRGLRDTLEHIFSFVAATLGFWLGIMSVVFAPCVLLTLFFVTDPRHGMETERPASGAIIRYLRTHWIRGWGLGLATVPALSLLFYNAVFYARHSGALNSFTPLWIVLFALYLMISLAAFSASALLDRSVKDSLRTGFVLTGKALPRFAFVTIITGLLTLLGAILVIPIILFLPATIAAIVNRMVLSELAISIADPNAPTPERLAEQRAAGNVSHLPRFLRRR